MAAALAGQRRRCKPISVRSPKSRSDPGEILNSANRFLTRSQTGHFVTMLLGRLEAPLRTFVYAAAGHQGYLFKADGEVHVLHSTAIPLGVACQFTASAAPAIALEAGDLLLLPTDGLEEAMDPAENFFGRGRMLAAMRRDAHRSAAEIVAALYAEVLAFIGDGPPRDDMTAVAAEFIRDYGQYRERKILGFREVDSYQKRQRAKATKLQATEKP